MTEDRMRYTSAAVSETHKLTQKEAGEGTEKFITIDGTGYNGFNLDWYPVVKVKDIVAKVVDSEGNTSDYTFKVVSSNGDATVVPGTDEAVVREDGTVILGAVSSSAQVITAGREIKIRYFYNNEIIPQTVQPVSLPTLTAKMQAVNLHAHARRIAINLYVA